LASSPDLCITCHEDVQQKLETERQHDPAAEDCLNCHQAHSASQLALIDQPLQALCGDCHDADEDSFRRSHLGIEAAAMDCIGCHAPHASKDPKFFKEQMHSPFVRGDCGECHVVGQE
jgi:predicted CXXCH cytochrome family protein